MRSHLSLRHGVLPPGGQRGGLQLLLAELVQAAAGHRLELWENRPTVRTIQGPGAPTRSQQERHSLEVGRWAELKMELLPVESRNTQVGFSSWQLKCVRG